MSSIPINLFCGEGGGAGWLGTDCFGAHTDQIEIKHFVGSTTLAFLAETSATSLPVVVFGQVVCAVLCPFYVLCCVLTTAVNHISLVGQ